MVTTVTGPMKAAELGFTLMHEHIVVGSWAMRQAFPGWMDRDAVVRSAVAALRAARELGVGAIVDTTPINLGRDIHLIREVSERAEMPIVATTGLFWTEEPWLEEWEAERLAE